MRSNPVVWFELYVQDMARAKAFYEGLFQGTMTPLENPNPMACPGMEMMAFPMSQEGYGAGGSLVKMPNRASSGNTLVYFGCEDCAVEAARAVSIGGKLIVPKMPIGMHGFIALIIDSEGNTIGLHSMC